MPEAQYSPAVQQLLQRGDTDIRGKWPQYTDMGLTEADIADLVRLATDPDVRDSEEPAAWGPVHAWRALGQLRAAAAVEPLLGELNWFEETDDDWGLAEIPIVLGMIGAPAIEPAARFALDEANAMYARCSAHRALQEVAVYHTEHRALCIEHMRRILEAGEANDNSLNGFFVAHLLTLKATEAAETIQQAYAKGWVDDEICGDWEDVERDLFDLPPKPIHPYLRDKAARKAEKLARRALQENPAPAAPPPPINHAERDRIRAERKRKRDARKRGRR